MAWLLLLYSFILDWVKRKSRAGWGGRRRDWNYLDNDVIASSLMHSINAVSAAVELRSTTKYTRLYDRGFVCRPCVYNNTSQTQIATVKSH